MDQNGSKRQIEAQLETNKINTQQTKQQNKETRNNAKHEKMLKRKVRVQAVSACRIWHYSIVLQFIIPYVIIIHIYIYKD